ncbi:MAG: hypothetical protein JAY78_22630 [Candidatus Thiodiazotropha taylori]|nr:hypothetical protein [Candidatus Thiodiazotropha taylori]
MHKPNTKKLQQKKQKISSSSTSTKSSSIKRKKNRVSGAADKHTKINKRRRLQKEDSSSTSESSSSEEMDSSPVRKISRKSNMSNKKSVSRKQILDLFSISSSEQSSTGSDSDDDNLGLFTDTQSSSVSKHMKKKIWNRDYINLSKLYYGKESLNLSMFLKKSKENTVTSMKRVPQRQIGNILSWCRAFQLYASIYCKKYPKEGSDMFQYMSIVQTLAHKGQNWLLYDQKFRQLRAKRKLTWSRLHVQTHLYQSLNRVPTTSYRAQSRNVVNQPTNVSSGQSQAAGVNREIFRRGYCWYFQRFGKCSRSSCSRTHKCSICNGQHAGSACTASGRASNRQAQGTSGSTPSSVANTSQS